MQLTKLDLLTLEGLLMRDAKHYEPGPLRKDLLQRVRKELKREGIHQ